MGKIEDRCSLGTVPEHDEYGHALDSAIRWDPRIGAALATAIVRFLGESDERDSVLGGNDEQRRAIAFELAGELGVGQAVQVLYDEPVHREGARQIQPADTTVPARVEACRTAAIVAVVDDLTVTFPYGDVQGVATPGDREAVIDERLRGRQDVVDAYAELFRDQLPPDSPA